MYSLREVLLQEVVVVTGLRHSLGVDLVVDRSHLSLNLSPVRITLVCIRAHVHNIDKRGNEIFSTSVAGSVNCSHKAERLGIVCRDDLDCISDLRNLLVGHSSHLLSALSLLPGRY